MAKLFKLPVPPKAKEGEEQQKPAYSLKGPVVVAGKTFQDGQLLVQNDDDAVLMAPILLRFHGCTVEDVAESSSAEAAAEGSLAATATKK